MSFQPVIPIGGIAGWAFLERTRDTQEAAFQAGPALTRDTDYFAQRIGDVTSADELVSDRRLLRVALGAFGLETDIDSKFFVRKVLEEGTLERESLANRLSDKRYLALSEAFGFDLKPPNTALSTFGAEIVAQYRERRFEAAVGETSPDMRLALSLDREVGRILERELSDTAAWFTVMATPPLRAVFERALGIPDAVGALGLDRQLEIFREKAASVLGSSEFSRIASNDALEALRTKFLARSELILSPQLGGRGAAALAILQGGQAPASGGLFP